MNIAALSLRLLKPKALSFERATRDPIAAQEAVLTSIIRRNHDTVYGRQHHFAEIRTIADFQKMVPVSDCESMRPHIERMAAGEEHILTADKPVFFGVTSGTTNHPKLIPTTARSQQKKTELMHLWSYYIARDHPDILNGKILAIVSPEVEGRTPSGLAFGAESGHGYRNLPFLVKHLYALPYEVFEIADYDARYYTILRIAMEQKITTVATLNPNTLLLLCQKIEKWQEMIIEDIGRGTIDPSWDIPANIRQVIQRRLMPNPKRAARLKRIRAEHHLLLPRYVWPQMQLIECWKGGTVNIYLKDLPTYFGSVPVRDLGCLSTEARCSIPLSDDGAGGVLAIQTNFYEFIPKEEIGRRNRRTLTAAELEKGREYFIVVTTEGGLYRYNIDDIIRVDGFFNKTPVIEFVQKGINAISLVGEKLYESQVNAALTAVLDHHKLPVSFFCAQPEQEGKTSRYALLVEFFDDVSPLEKKDFLKAMDAELYRQNREYDYTRGAQLLQPPVLKVVKRGEAERYRQKRIAEGAHDGQFKMPELAHDFTFAKNFQVEEVVSF